MSVQRHRGWMVLLVLVLLSVAGRAGAETAPAAGHEWWPGGTYDAAVPTPRSVLGYDVGERVTEYRNFERYLAALDAGCSRLNVTVYGESYEGRPLYQAVVATPGHLEERESIRQRNLKLADPRRLSGAKETAEILGANPAIAWMNYGNDGNETAALEAAMQTLYQLCAGTDEATRKILDQLVVIITPALNPESRERFVSYYNAFSVGPDGAPDPAALEHNAPWGVDTNNNHYQIDLNRDAGLMTQQESRAMGRVYLEWMPQVFVDHHGETVNMFFPPVVEPVNANLPETTRKWHAIYGRSIAEGFDRFGWSYFTGEVFDDFYFGYWDTYPNLHGAVGMTFETDGGGSNGLRIERPDGTLLTLLDGVHHHFVATMQTLRAAADRREEVLRDFLSFHRANLEPGRHGGVRAYLIPPGRDPQRAWSLVEVLLQDGIEVTRAREPFALDRVRGYDDAPAGRRSFPAGTYIVPMSQPASAVAHALLEKDPLLPKGFVEAQRRRKDQDLPTEFYDITAWSFPVAFGVEAFWSEMEPKVASEPVSNRRPDESGRLLGGDGRYGYLIPGDSNAGLALTVRLMREGYVAAVADMPFVIDRQAWPRGTTVMRAVRNRADLREAIARGAREVGVDVTAVESAWTEVGISLGSTHVRMVRLPRIAVLAGEGFEPTSYGAIWFMFEREIGLPFTPITLADLARVDLRRYDVMIFPDAGEGEGGLEHLLRDREIEALRTWVRLGGVAVGVRQAALVLGSSKLGLVPASAGRAEHDEEGGADTQTEPRGGTGSVRGEEEAADKPLLTPGALLRVDLDPGHYLTAGYGATAAVLVDSDTILRAGEDSRVIARFAPINRLRIGGFLWPEAAEALSGSPYLVEQPVDRGKLILFADDPNFRLLLRGLRRLFLNSVLLAPYLSSEASVF